MAGRGIEVGRQRLIYSNRGTKGRAKVEAILLSATDLEARRELKAFRDANKDTKLKFWLDGDN